MRANRLRNNGRFICEEAFLRRKGYYTAKEGGLLRQEELPEAANPMANPEKMMGPMKSQVFSDNLIFSSRSKLRGLFPF